MLTKDKKKEIDALMKNPVFKREMKGLITKIKERKITEKQMLGLKQKISKKFNLDFIIPNSLILEYNASKDVFVNYFLLKKKIRTLSGVAVVAVMVAPHKCPGKCIYCPSNTGVAPKSYTGLEPATRRAIMFNFDSYKQAKNRLEQLKAIGHNTQKIEIIIMGGTFLSMPKKYQVDFVKGIFDALNEKESKNLNEAKEINQTAKQRCVGLTIETRPDYCGEKEIKQMLYLGATRVELGVQILNNEIYLTTKRGHTIEDVAKATEILRNSGLKIVYHIMPGLGTKKQDLDAFDMLFEKEHFLPDMLKIYPTLVIKGTKLYDLWIQKKYNPLGAKEAVKLICKLKRKVPEYVRIMRIQRDISKEKIEAGVDAGNLRELLEKEMTKEGVKCKCIRCREAGHNIYKKTLFNKENNIENHIDSKTTREKTSKNIKIKTMHYTASKGEEYFISFVGEKNILYGYLRLRVLNKNCRLIVDEITPESAIIRELKVFGTSTPLGEEYDFSFQHKGFGRKLIEEAVKIAKKENKGKLFVMSAIGTREYYKQFGFAEDGVYMSRKI